MAAGDTTVGSTPFCGAKERARALGYKLEELPLFAAGMSPRRFNAMLQSRGIIGIIIAPLRNGGDTLPITWEHFSAVGIGFTLKRPFIPRIGNDHAHSVRLAIQECRRRGYQRIGLVLTYALLAWVEEQWLAGYLIEHTSPKTVPHPKPLLVDSWKKRRFLGWFRHERPDAILVAGDTEPFVSWLRDARVAVPEDVGVVALDLHVHDGSVAGIEQHSEENGAAAVDQLVAQMHRNERGSLPRPLRIHVMGSWREGATLRLPRKCTPP